jgi:hypothetical protein
MKYCPDCAGEYFDEKTECADCTVPLVDGDQWQAWHEADEERRTQLRDAELAPLCSVGGRLEAQALLGMLADEGIPALLRSYEETAFDGLFVNPKGWGQLWVVADRTKEAEALVAAYRQSAPPKLPEDE